ncbi:hypothetical protein P4S72_07800 [Vibrio sp. PP-XX7]
MTGASCAFGRLDTRVKISGAGLNWVKWKRACRTIEEGLHQVAVVALEKIG